MGYRAVIFDLYGTLVDNYGYGSEAEPYGAMHAAMAQALELPAREFREAWGNRSYWERTSGQFPTLEAAIAAASELLGAAPTPEQVTRAASIRSEFMTNALTPRPDALSTLIALHDLGIKTALISNCGPDTALLWPKSALATLIDVPVLSCAVGLTKRDPDIFWLACERLDVDPPEALYVADGESHELATAAFAGLQPVLIRSSYRDPPFFRQPHVEPWEGPEIAFLMDVLDLVR